MTASPPVSTDGITVHCGHIADRRPTVNPRPRTTNRSEPELGPSARPNSTRTEPEPEPEPRPDRADHGIEQPERGRGLLRPLQELRRRPRGGAAPVYRGRPATATHRDGDGIGCEL